MKNEDVATAFGAAVVVGLLGTVVIAAVFGPNALAGMFGPAGAAWAQAIGTVGAVVVAIWVARQEQRVRKQKAAIAFEFFRSTVQQGASRGHFGAIAQASIVTDEAAALLRDAYALGCSLDLGDLEPIKALEAVRLRTELSQALTSFDAVSDGEGALMAAHNFNLLKVKLERMAARCGLAL